MEKVTLGDKFIQQFLNYRGRHPEEGKKFSSIYDHYFNFLTTLLGMEEREAQHEVGLMMNAACDAMD